MILVGMESSDGWDAGNLRYGSSHGEILSVCKLRERWIDKETGKVREKRREREGFSRGFLCFFFYFFFNKHACICFGESAIVWEREVSCSWPSISNNGSLWRLCLELRTRLVGHIYISVSVESYGRKNTQKKQKGLTKMNQIRHDFQNEQSLEGRERKSEMRVVDLLGHGFRWCNFKIWDHVKWREGNRENRVEKKRKKRGFFLCSLFGSVSCF